MLRYIFIAIIAYYIFKTIFGDVCEGYCAVNSNNDDNIDSQYNTRGQTCGQKCGWTNSVTNDGSNTGMWAPEDTKGQQRIYKYPHYYGYGTASGFHYGEPYYTRSVNY